MCLATRLVATVTALALAVGACHPAHASGFTSLTQADGQTAVSLVSPLPVASVAPAGATVMTNTSANVANATASAALGAVAGQTNFVTGFQFTASGATSAAVVTCTLVGVKPYNQFYTVAVPAGVTAGVTPLSVSFNPPLQATNVNVAITASCPALGSGNTNATMNIQGYSY